MLRRPAASHSLNTHKLSTSQPTSIFTEGSRSGPSPSGTAQVAQTAIGQKDITAMTTLNSRAAITGVDKLPDYYGFTSDTKDVNQAKHPLSLTEVNYCIKVQTDQLRTTAAADAISPS